METDLNKFTGERCVWTNPTDHLKEFAQCNNYYFEAMQYAKGKRVVDVACGSGLGTFFLSLVAEETFGLDIIDHGGIWDALPTVAPTKWLKIDLEKEPVDITADLAVSIETIEHLANPEYFLSNLKAKNLFFTVPCYGDKNPFHKIQYSEESCKALIEKYFPILTYRMEKRRMIGYAQKKETA